MTCDIVTHARRFVSSRSPWTRGEAEDFIVALADEIAEWKRGSATVNERLLARIAELEAENARLNMEMAAYRQGCTPKDAAAMLAVVDALEVEKQMRCGPHSDRRCPNMMHKRYAMLNCTECSALSGATQDREGEP